MSFRTKSILTHLLVAIAACGATWLYLRFSAPRFWDQRLDIQPVSLKTLKEKNVYWSRDLKKVRFVMRPEDKCFYIDNDDFSFGEAGADMMWYEKMILFCPDKGVGWVNNAW